MILTGNPEISVEVYTQHSMVGLMEELGSVLDGSISLRGLSKGSFFKTVDIFHEKYQQPVGKLSCRVTVDYSQDLPPLQPSVLYSTPESQVRSLEQRRSLVKRERRV
jgi:hypothetical protein